MKLDDTTAIGLLAGRARKTLMPKHQKKLAPPKGVFFKDHTVRDIAAAYRLRLHQARTLCAWVFGSWDTWQKDTREPLFAILSPTTLWALVDADTHARAGAWTRRHHKSQTGLLNAAVTRFLAKEGF